MSIIADDVAYLSGATVTSSDWTPNRPFSTVTILTTPTDAGTVQVFHVDANDTEHALEPAVAVSANAQDVQVFDYHINKLRVKYVNTDASAGTVLIEVHPGGSK